MHQFVEDLDDKLADALTKRLRDAKIPYRMCLGLVHNKPYLIFVPYETIEPLSSIVEAARKECTQ